MELARRFYLSTNRRDLPYPLVERFMSRIDRELRDLETEKSANCYFSSLKEAYEFLDRYAAEDEWLQQNFGISRCDKQKASELRFLHEEEIEEQFKFLEKDINDWFSEADIA